MDISADLHELTRCPVGLVSAGVKSILDIGQGVGESMALKKGQGRGFMAREVRVN